VTGGHPSPDPWVQVDREIQLVVDERKSDYDPATIANVRDLVATLRSTGRPTPRIGAGYWRTFRVTWTVPGAANLEIEVFEDRLEVYRFFEGRTAILYEAHAAGQSFTPAFLAALPANEPDSN